MNTSAPETTAPRRAPRLVWVIVASVVAAVVIVVLARWIRELPATQDFIADFHGTSALPDGAPVGLPAWLGWQHGLNTFFLIFIVRSGLQLHSKKRPSAFWTRDNTRFVKTKSAPRRLSIDLWLHICVDTLWVVNGVVYIVVLFATGQWVRVVPTNWDIVPNAISAGLQYASLDWPSENGWVNYNALQVISYFVVIFIAGPVAVITGLRMSPGWPQKDTLFNRVVNEKRARTVHYATLIFFLIFTAVHVFLVLTTGAIDNLNHMYAARNDGGWLGFWIFVASTGAMVGAVFALTPAVLRAIAGKFGAIRVMPAPPKK
ncbi:thiosulfate reductase cytochrome b subunit [Conyzicola lurida]|uniref:Thiosulfate reductase cytochrome b subunit n=1 Tax=Conyzicola lurida TaxID=1172621 RepID=A0A841AJV4_9MICO|nr:thiosulfate reductase cytochrome b subunit [Conyzicola lurida]